MYENCLCYCQVSFIFLVPQINIDVLGGELTIRGFIIYSFVKEFDTAWNEMVPLVKKVKEKHEELVCL